MDEFDFIYICIPLFCLVLIGIGLFLSFYKRKLPPGVSPTAWIDKLNVPDYAKDVRRKEAAKNTARIFTFTWFKEYWRGERTAISAFFCWSIYLPLLFLFVILVVFSIEQPAHIEVATSTYSIMVMSIIIFFQLYFIFANVIWWKCAKNSTMFNKYLVRIMVAINILYYVFIVII